MLLTALQTFLFLENNSWKYAQIFQTYFGFSNIGSDMHNFKVVIISFVRKWFAHPQIINCFNKRLVDDDSAKAHF